MNRGKLRPGTSKSMLRRRGRSTAKALKNALAQLGMQAGDGEIVAHLATLGIAATEWQVQHVRLELLKHATDLRKRAVMPIVGKQRRLQRPPKTVPRRNPRP
jgi:hypothetical protein